ncbi:ABC-F family ATP-binding cassette domain-containing protein [Solihabitans fulvus]|uniref:ABC-F family ATP-binding cassette domain-containing protein n=1 Tax=Solihabitans fulvus TaxID=1892852 RepID=A0A5B2X443_9PSEU|nr:ABC-F family ATP-binding cassette domain-containing protein [Solihabitans fulvus]KAA2257920.1 ABC-F family ATP-binding cassette domain-containing protein [Solihabitans fulvus]
MPTQLALRGVSKSYAGRPVLDAVTCAIRPGEHVGVVGENGSGKSTLLRLLSGVEAPDDGEVTVTADGGVGHLGQTLDLPPEATVAEVIDTALADLRAIERALRAAEATLGAAGPEELAAYGELSATFEARGGYRADAEVDAAMHGLGVGGLARDRRLGSLSGGEQARLALACLLAAAPEVLLLDEPTNHLDTAAVSWLEDRLRAHRGTVVAVSHDRTFLDRVATAILEVDGDRHTLTRYAGGYAGFLAEQAAARHRWEQRYQQWCTEIAALVDSATTTALAVAHDRPPRDREKMGYGRRAGRVQGSVSSRVRNVRERLHRLRADPVPRPPDPLRFAARPTAGTVADGALVTLAGVAVGDRLVVDEFAVSAGERLLVHGGNGAGKTTLLRVLAGDLVPDRGTVRQRGRIGYLAQEIPVTRPRTGLLASFAEGMVGTQEEHADVLLSLGLFRAQDLHTPVGALSVGQRRRLALARLLVREVDLLLLDEPTNHLSLALVEDVEVALAEYRGAVVVVSHDRLLRSRFPGGRREMRAGRLVA